jgi:hypothetical protein
MLTACYGVLVIFASFAFLSSSWCLAGKAPGIACIAALAFTDSGWRRLAVGYRPVIYVLVSHTKFVGDLGPLGGFLVVVVRLADILRTIILIIVI